MQKFLVKTKFNTKNDAVTVKSLSVVNLFFRFPFEIVSIAYFQLI